MDAMETVLENWAESRAEGIPLAGLLSRNPIAYKWTALHHIHIIREGVSWRLHDLLVQSYKLHQHSHGLGARILLRSGFETLAILIYLNQKMRQVLKGELNFHLFSEQTMQLLLGSRDGSTKRQSLNIMTILEKCDKIYPGIANIYGILSESAHPNYEGLTVGYSKLNRAEFETRFSNRWTEMYGEKHTGTMNLCIETFLHEYNDVWCGLMQNLEDWIERNDSLLEATKNAPR